jgi:1-pyrroline-5-carboxylate dehydrogenase
MNRLLRKASALPQLVKDDERVGAVMNQQPFGGSRASGTAARARREQRLARVGNKRQGRLDAEPAAMGDPRTIKETFVPATPVGYRHQETE